MNKRLPYEEEMARRLENIPLPGENEAWADMKRRLEEEDGDRFIPFWLNGCLSWALLGVIALTVGWWIVRPEKWFDKKDVTINKTLPVSQPREKEQNYSLQKEETKQDSNVLIETTSSRRSDRIKNHKKEILGLITHKQGLKNSAQNRNATKESDAEILTKVTTQLKANDDLSKSKNPIITANQFDNDKTNSSSTQNQTVISDSSRVIAHQNIDTAKSSIEKKKKDSLQENKFSNEEKSDSAKSSKFWFGAGISLYQQLPINGQKFVPYNSEGRKGSLADYIPAVYLRMYRGDKWFIQSEFRYGAPQYTKEFLYQQKNDSAVNGYITQSTSLKKTYYHQLPLTFNYFVSTDLAVGAGIIWNKFVSAISSQDITRHNIVTGADSVISRGTILVTKTPDTSNVFTKSWFQALFEVQYRWNRFSLGARYAVGLQPYIKFELQPGVPQQEKNSSLNIFLRYELWRSKKK